MASARNRGMNKGKIVSLDKVIAAIKCCRRSRKYGGMPYPLGLGVYTEYRIKSFYAAGRTLLPIRNVLSAPMKWCVRWN